MPPTAYIALGSNLGDRRQYLQGAFDRLAQIPGLTVLRISNFLETQPVGGPPNQGNYLNAVAALETSLSAEDLLGHLLRIEDELGRVRQERFGPRTLDLDLLLYGMEIIDIHRPGLDLTVPHPRMHARLFVLEPLAEIAPWAVHPVLGSTVLDLCRRLQQPDPLSLHGLKALVTGSTSGIGAAIALALGQAGADVLVHGRRSGERAQGVAGQIEKLGRRSGFFLADLRDDQARTDLVELAWNQWDGLDIWINNAGADTLTGEAGHWPFEKKFQELWSMDVASTIFLSRVVGQKMKARGTGVILNMGWDQAETGMEGDSGQLFGAVKGAIMAFSRSLALTLAPQVRLNCLAPGWIRTAWGEGASAPWQERVLCETPLARWGTPQDIAAAAAWLVSPAANYVTGQIVRINGGAVR